MPIEQRRLPRPASPKEAGPELVAGGKAGGPPKSGSALRRLGALGLVTPCERIGRAAIEDSQVTGIPWIAGGDKSVRGQCQSVPA